MKKLEILAPVGGPEQLIAAVRSGADAVYLGTTGFNARRNAKNFESSDLPSVVSYCHERGVKVHVTVNTLVFDDELALLEKEADAIAAAGTDAVIIQDLAVAELFAKRYPSIRRHASTQMAVHDLAGAIMAQNLGFDRVVLARELRYEEIRKINENVDIETEMFVHGAHCMSLSGACYLSSLIGGRSGNRGMCAQPCRTDFRVGNKSYALSLKDMSYVSRIPALEDTGVVSLKIEGRMKRPEYVAAAVTACRQSRDGEAYDLASLEKIFSRSGFTQGYLDGKRTADMFGIRTKSDVEASAQVISSLASLYRAEYPAVGVDMTLDIGNELSSLTVTDGVNTVSASGPAPAPAQNRPLDEAYARRCMEKTGNTPYHLKNLDFTCPDGVFMSAAQLNTLRSDALGALSAIRGKVIPHKRHECDLDVREEHKAGSAELYIKCETFRQAAAAGDCARIILPASEILANRECVSLFGDRLICAFEPVLFPDDEDKFEETVKRVCALGVSRAWTENIYGVQLASRLGMEIYGGAALNITNSRALRAYEKLGFSALTVSFETLASRISQLRGSIPRGTVVYGYLPAMQTRACPVKGASGCAGCTGNTVLRDRTGAQFPYICHGRRYGTLYNSVALYAADRKIDNIDFVLAVFTLEEPQEVREIAKLIREKAPFYGKMTRGLYFRAVQ